MAQIKEDSEHRGIKEEKIHDKSIQTDTKWTLPHTEMHLKIYHKNNKVFIINKYLHHGQ